MATTRMSWSRSFMLSDGGEIKIAFNESRSETMRKRLLDRTTGFQKSVNQVLLSRTFNISLCTLIVMNFCVTIVDTDIRSNENADVPVWMDIVERITLLVFILELLARIYGGRSQFFHDPWNVFDLTIVSADVIFGLHEFMNDKDSSPVDISVVRICRLLRIFTLLRKFPELDLLTTSFVGSIQAVLWGSLFLVIILIIWSIAAVQYIHPLIKTLVEEGNFAGCSNCHQAFATVPRSLLTFMQTVVVGDGWGELAVPVIQSYPVTAIFFVGCYLNVGMALVNLITGVIVNVADSARERQLHQLDEEKLKSRVNARDSVMELLQDMDGDGAGFLTQSAFRNSYDRNDKLQALLEHMNIEQNDLSMLWTILDDDKTGKVPVTSFVNHMFKMKCSENTFMLTCIKYYLTVIKDRILERLNKGVSTALATEEQNIPRGTLELEQNTSIQQISAWKARHSAWKSKQRAIGAVLLDAVKKPQETNTPVPEVDLTRRNKSTLRGDSSVDPFDDVLAGANEVRAELARSFQCMDEKLNSFLSKASSHLRQFVTQENTCQFDNGTGSV